MSLFSFATSNLTTADRKRCPAIDRGQFVRTLILCVLFLIALGMMARRSDAAESGFPGFDALETLQHGA